MFNKKSFALLAALPLLIACTDPVSTSSSNTSHEDEKEVFTNPIVQRSMDAFLKGFRMEGTITQSRRLADSTNQTLETNTYYTTIAFNSDTENAYYKYSYQYDAELGGELPIEGPYIFFEGEDGYAYQETINASNEVTKEPAKVGSNIGSDLTFADNGFYNFFSILIDSDFTLDESSSNRFDLNIDKAGLISNNLLYSLNSGTYGLPSEAYLLASNEMFSELHITMEPLTSYDSMANQYYIIDNTISFTLLDAGKETIKHIEAYPETEDGKVLSEAFKAYTDDVSYKLTVDNSYTVTDLNAENPVPSSHEEISDYYFTTDKAMYIHDRANKEDTSLNKASDYYLAPNANNRLQAYKYDGNSFVAYEGNITEGEGDDALVRFPSTYNNYYTYSDMTPDIAMVSGSLFDKNSETNVYEAKEELISTLANALSITKRPYLLEAVSLNGIASIDVTINSENSLTIVMPYGYIDTLATGIYQGKLSLTYSLGDYTISGLTA